MNNIPVCDPNAIRSAASLKTKIIENYELLRSIDADVEGLISEMFGITSDPTAEVEKLGCLQDYVDAENRILSKICSEMKNIMSEFGR